MAKPKKIQNSLSYLRKDWSVAELEISFKRKHKTNVIIDGAQSANNAFRAMWDDSLFNVQEQLCAIFLNVANEVMGFRVINTGLINKCEIDINLIVACAIKTRSLNVVIAHNHPSGRCLPSSGDERITRTILERLRFFDITLLYHLILTEDKYYSFTDFGFFD